MDLLALVLGKPRAVFDSTQWLHIKHLRRMLLCAGKSLRQFLSSAPYKSSLLIAHSGCLL